MRGRWALAVVLVLLGTFIVAPTSRVGASHADGTYELPVWFTWDEAVLDVLIVPPNHGQIYNGNGVLDGGDPGELTPFNSYLDAIEASVSDWDAAIQRFGPDWLRTGLVTNVYVVGRDAIPTGALADPEVVIATDETKGNILGLAFSTDPCLVDNSKFFIESFTYEDMFNINSQEYGHCLGLEHVVDNHPEHDAMAGLYADDVGAKDNHLHCVSTLDVLGLTAVFGGLFGHQSPDIVSLPVEEYTTTCSSGPDVGGSTPTPAPSDTPTGSPSPSPTASSTPEPSPSASPEEPVVHERSITLRLRRHLVARGRVEASDDASHCYRDARVDIQKRAGSRWRVSGSSLTRDDGVFRLRLSDRAGTYRAVVRRDSSGAGDCARAASPRRIHRH